MPSGNCAVTSTTSPLLVAAVTFVPVRTRIFFLRKLFSSSSDTAASSLGTMRGSSSITVTSVVPKLLKIDANSTPTAPLPITMIDLGTSRRFIASVLVMMRL